MENIATEIESELRDYEWSLLRVKIEQPKYFLKKPDEKVDDCGRCVNVFHVAAKLIQTDIEDDLEKIIDDDLKHEPNNIHAWRNKVQFHLCKKNVEKARAATVSLRRALDDRVAVEMAKIDYACWIAKSFQKASAWEKSCDIFTSIETNSNLVGRLEFEQVLAISKFLHLKIQLRYCKSELGYTKPDKWQSEKLKILFGLLKDLRDSSLPSNEDLFLLWLADVLLLPFCRTHQNNPTVMNGISQLAELMHINPQSLQTTCLEKIIQWSQSTQVDHKTLEKIGRICMLYGSKSDDDKVYERLTNQAIQSSKKSLKTDPKLYITLCTVANAHINLWALKYYKDTANKQLIMKEREEIYGDWRAGKREIMRFLTEGLYMVRVEDSDNHLQQAHHCLQIQREYIGSSADRTSLLAWVKYLLHHDDAEVLELLKEAADSHKIDDRTPSRLQACTMLGRYYEKCGEETKASDSYRKAVDVTHGNLFEPVKAINCLTRLNWRNAPRV